MMPIAQNAAWKRNSPTTSSFKNCLKPVNSHKSNRRSLKVKLLSLKLHNFKGIKSFEMQANGENVAVYGDNATGKTTLFDAFLWLLFGKDSQNRNDFGIKTIDSNGNPIHGLEYEVEGRFLVDGQPLILRKVYKEQWTKKRGSVVAEFTGHTTDYYINGVPVQKKEYDAKISEIADEKLFKLLTNPMFFNTQLHWQDRRKTLLQLCGDISDGEVIESNSKLAALPAILQGRKLEDHRKVIAARRSEINNELQSIPIRISEVERSKPVVVIENPDNLDNEIAILKKQKESKMAELSEIASGGELAIKMGELRRIENEILQIENEFKASIYNEVEVLQKQLTELRLKESELRQKTTTKPKAPNLIDTSRIEQDIQKLRNQWHEVNQQEFVFSQETVCPTCGQPIPESQLQEAREKALAEFNQRKAEKLEAITNDGKALAQKLEQIKKENQAEIDRINAENVQIELAANQAASELEKISCQMAEIREQIAKKQAESVKNDPLYSAKAKEKAAVLEAIEAIKNGQSSDAQARIQTEIQTLDSAIAALVESKSKLAQIEFAEQRIEELKRQERALAAEYERLEHELYLTEEFIRTKVNLLEEKINGKFKMARFKLFEQQINGGLSECCETMFNGVPFADLNNAAKINIGLDIINTLSDHYGFTAPIFVDNAEAVTQLIPTVGQVITLVVSETDKALRVEPRNNSIKEVA